MPKALSDVSEIPAIDAHCHPFEERPLSWQLLLDSLTLSQRGPVSALNDAKTLSRIATRGLAAVLGCEPDAEAIVAARNAASNNDYTTFVGRLFSSQRIAGLLVDPGYPDFPVIDAAEFARRTPVLVWEGYRIERFFPLEGSFHGAAGAKPQIPFAEMCEAFAAELDTQATRPGFVFFKSVMAYHTGLAIGPVSDGEARTAWAEHRAYGDPAEKTIRDYLFRVTCAKARQHGAPLQLHTGHTSHYKPWPEVNPILLAPVLNEPEIAETSLVLVHGGYPYCTEAGYLTSLYPNVTCDLSLMIPWASAGAARRILETLEWAPTAKVMYGSDGVDIPEMHWIGALVGRRGVARALGELVDEEALDANEAQEVARDILYRNAERVYGVSLTAEMVTAESPRAPLAGPDAMKLGSRVRRTAA